MIDDQVVVTVERLRDDLAEFRKALRTRYPDPARPVTAKDLRKLGAQLAEAWMVKLAVREDIREQISSDYLGNLSVAFQRVLTCSEHSSQRKQYDSALKLILSRFTMDLIIPLKQARHQASATAMSQLATSSQQPAAKHVQSDDQFQPTAFVGHSFLAPDKTVADAVIAALTAIGITVVSGEKPKADKISEKVKKLIEDQHLFVGIFTRRDRLAGKKEWTTSQWVLDEKAYALGRGKKLILLREEGVGSIGGIQGDYEFIDFNRERLQELVIRLAQLFHITTLSLRH